MTVLYLEDVQVESVREEKVSEWNDSQHFSSTNREEHATTDEVAFGNLVFASFSQQSPIIWGR